MLTIVKSNNALAITLVLGLGACLLLFACEMSPSQTIPNLPSIIASLRTAKDTSEDRASMVKGASRIRFKFRKIGEKLYGDARAKHNAAIAWMVTSLSQDSADPIELDALLSDADNSRIKFHEWCDGPARNEGVAECASCGIAVEALVNIADLFVNVIQMHNQIAVQQRHEIQQQLSKCEWVSWAELRDAN